MLGDCALGLSASRQGLVAGRSEKNNELSGFIKFLGLPDELRN